MNIVWIIIIVIVALAVIGIAISLLKAVFFSPRINSGISIILMLGVSIYVLFFLKGDNLNQEVISGLKPMLLLFIVPIIDCIRDIIVADEFYEEIDFSEMEVDKFYAAKSIVSIVTVELARYIYLLVVCPIISIKVKKDVQTRLNAGSALPYYKFYSNSPRFQYYYSKNISKLEKNGSIVSNIDTVKSETAIRKKRLDVLYPEKIVNRIVDAVAGDVNIKEMRKEAEKQLSPSSISKYYAYIGSNVYQIIPQTIITAMSSRGSLSLVDIINLPEMKPLNFKEINTDITTINNKWAEYFVIMALTPLVEKNEFFDDDYGVKEPWDNHHYEYSKSTRPKPSINADEDPRFTLDDDDE